MIRICRHYFLDKDTGEYTASFAPVRKNVVYCKKCGMKLHPIEIGFINEKIYYLNTKEGNRSKLRDGREKIVDTNLPIPRLIL